MYESTCHLHPKSHWAHRPKARTRAHKIRHLFGRYPGRTTVPSRVRLHWITAAPVRRESVGPRGTIIVLPHGKDKRNMTSLTQGSYSPAMRRHYEGSRGAVPLWPKVRATFGGHRYACAEPYIYGLRDHVADQAPLDKLKKLKDESLWHLGADEVGGQ